MTENVTKHTAYGIGVYSYFRDNSVWMDTGIKAPKASGIMFYNAFIKHLAGNGGIAHILNDEGNGAYNYGISYLCGEHEYLQ